MAGIAVKIRPHSLHLKNNSSVDHNVKATKKKFTFLQPLQAAKKATPAAQRKLHNKKPRSSKMEKMHSKKM